MCPIFVADQLAAQRGEHVGVADGLLVAVPRGGAAAGVDVCLGVAVQGVPDDRDRLREEPERDGPLDRFLDAVAGLTDAVSLGFLMAGLDRPAAVIARDQLGRGGVDVGRGDRDVEALLSAV